MQKVLIYNRMESTFEAALTHHENVLKEYYGKHFALNGYAFGGFYRDDCMKTAICFRQRPGGGKLLLDAIRGDMILGRNLDTVFAGIEDMYETLVVLKSRGLSFHSSEIGLTVSKEEPGAFQFLEKLIELERAIQGWTAPKQPPQNELYEYYLQCKARAWTGQRICDHWNSIGFRTYSKRRPWTTALLRVFVHQMRHGRATPYGKPKLDKHDKIEEPQAVQSGEGASPSFVVASNEASV